MSYAPPIQKAADYAVAPLAVVADIRLRPGDAPKDAEQLMWMYHHWISLVDVGREDKSSRAGQKDISVCTNGSFFGAGGVYGRVSNAGHQPREWT